MRLNRRELLAAGGATLALPSAARAGGTWTRTLDFARVPAGDGWPGWTCTGVANLRRRDGTGLLEAGSDVFPYDPRPVAFAVDQRFLDGEVTAAVSATGAGAGVVLRRVGPRRYYAAVYDDEQGALVLLRRDPGGVVELARAPAPPGSGRLSLSAQGPTLAASWNGTRVTARDTAITRAGDPGVLATARTLFPSSGPSVLPALGNLHLLPYGVQEGQAFLDTAVGAELLAQIRERSTAVFSSITVRAAGRPGVTRASVVAATTGTPGRVRVAADVPARVEIELSKHPDFRHARRIDAGRTNAFNAALPRLGKVHGRVYWRARLHRRGRVSVGPARSFRVPDGRARIAIGACAAQFGPIFDELARRHPDIFVWQGDLNYPDTVGPLAQTVPAYAGIWRELLANPRLRPILDRTSFAVQRDDHDYGVQDANSTNIVPWGLAPWEGLMEARTYYRFAAGPAEVWVLDQRRFKSDPARADTVDKTLLGLPQRRWLLRTLAASRAPFKVVCSPCTLAPVSGNARDGSWAAGFTAERDLLLRHVRRRVAGRTLFVTGDTHWTLVYDRDGLFEARPCPLGIPTPNDITLTSPQAAEDARDLPGVVYADDNRGHFALIDVDRSALTLTLVRDDGATPFRRTFIRE